MKLLVASAYPLIGQALVALLQGVPVAEDAIAVCCCNLHDVPIAASQPDIDVILVDMFTDAAAAIAAARQVRQEHPLVHVAMLGFPHDESTVYKAVAAGADGFLTMDMSVDTCLSTLHGLKHDELGLSRVAAMQVVRQLRRTPRAVDISSVVYGRGRLTPREREILDLTRHGLCSREISAHLGISAATVYKHIQHILKKLEVHSRTAAVYKAVRGEIGLG